MTKTDVKNVARKSRRKRDRHKKSTSSEEDRPRTATLKRPFILDESLKDKVSLNLRGRPQPHSTIDSVLALQPAAPGSIPGVPEVFSETFFREGRNWLDEKIVDAAKVNQQHCCLEQWTAEA